jgi:hypothetical protein
MLNRYVQETSSEGVIIYLVTAVKGAWLTLTSTDGVEMKIRKGELESDETLELMPEDFDAVEAEEEESEATSKMSKQLLEYRKRYAISITPEGRKSLSNGDRLAEALQSTFLPELYNVVEEILGVDLRSQYERLNKGSQRMNLGNRLRAAYKKPEHEKHDLVVDWVNARLDQSNGE